VNELGSVTVKGKEQPVVIYDLVGLRADASTESQYPNHK
jgi:hypothetical protein